MGEKAENVNPLLAALPPASDYLTYLTIIEYNLTEENLPVLHQVLQDTELTRNIGWDLVHLLLPLLPASEECLQDIAARGNPREVILKATEALRLLEFEEPAEDSEEDEDEEEALDEAKSTGKAPAVQTRESSTSPGLIPAVPPPLTVVKFEVLLELLSTLHRRVKTKYPSRFLSTSLQAVLAAYNRAKHHHDELTVSAVKFVKTLSGTKRPHLPPRQSSQNLLRTTTGLSEPDPEAQTEPPTADEETLSNRLLQSFITHILEDYILSLSSSEDVPGLAWSSRLMEKFEPHRVIPNKQTYADRFAKDESLESRSAIVGQLVAIARDLGLKTEDLVQAIMDPEAEGSGVPGTDDEPPNSAQDIPLSKTGSLFLFAARNVRQELYATTSNDDDSFIHIFPEHAAILNNFIGTLGPQTAGLEPEALLDAILSLGLIALEKNNVGEPADDEHFTKYLQTTSLISANTPSPSLRYHAHYLTTTILRSHPHDLVRLTFIRDTLEHCPYENLKASAVSWLKGETLEANMSQHPASQSSAESSIFATPVALSTVAPYLLPDLTHSWPSSPDLAESWIQFRTDLDFIMAALNFYFLLLTARPLHENLDVRGLHAKTKIEAFYLAPLKEGAGRFKEALGEGGELVLVVGEGDEELGQARGDVAVLEDGIARVEGAIARLGG
ncbi:YAP-binding/ALF4/Glomulin [Massariosphaeria phaeospora]|uniref:YAP-binding/ALF4/Glomulin n=1 Tax=Massariosphaeria phaeospora TaxID=100035 RepID=A0A7C8M4K4_9PLEO|nr:YAP-binding/ALF4/Glomulin [Massariosphaeria phaeospora]